MTTAVAGTLRTGLQVAGAIMASSGAPVVAQGATGIRWGGGIRDQGLPWEEYLAGQMPPGSRLPQNFKAFDFFDEKTGVAISAKTLDTTTPTKRADPRGVYSSLKGNVDAAAGFTEYQLNSKEVTSEMISSRELRVAVPQATNPAQWQEINRAVEYGQSRGVTVKVTIIKP